jgi:hypothetical protein
VLLHGYGPYAFLSIIHLALDSVVKPIAIAFRRTDATTVDALPANTRRIRGVSFPDLPVSGSCFGPVACVLIILL